MTRWLLVLLLGACDGSDAVDASVPDAPGADVPAADGGDLPPPVDDPFAGLPLVLEIDTASIAPTDEVSPAGPTSVTEIAGRPARVLPMGDAAARMTYHVGAGAGLEAGHTYLLEVEYPDDVSRAFFMANRGADLTRGWATGRATGDARVQFVAPSLESLDYPQTGAWQRYRQLFVMHEHLQGIENVRACTGCRPHTPDEGFDVVFFQTWRSNDPRSEGIAIGRIRLYEVTDPAALRAPLHRPPLELPQRYVFWREEMADQAIDDGDAADRAFEDPLDWYRGKLTLAGALGIDTYARDLLEFGYDQGWDSGDITWVNNAQPPLTDIWPRIVDLATSEGFSVVPYYEYRGSIGWTAAGPTGLAPERRAHKLYHGVRPVCGSTTAYTCTWWAEDANVDLTDPDTRADFFRMLDLTIGRDAAGASVPALWLRTRHDHLPISFADPTIARFVAARPEDAGTTIEALRASYEGDHALYDRYVDWWMGERARFLEAVRDHARSLAGDDLELIFTPWITEQVPTLLAPDASWTAVGVVTDDPAWFDAYARTFPDGFLRWGWVPRPFAEIVDRDFYGESLRYRAPAVEAYGSTVEEFHAAPSADPERYRTIEGVLPTYPLGRLFTVADDGPISRFRVGSGLAVVHHYTLNETNGDWWDTTPESDRGVLPFANLVGYAAVDVDRAGPVVMLEEARAIALGDPRVLAWLSGSSFSTGFPRELRRFYQAFVAVPALPSTIAAAASTHPDVVVREIPTPAHGTYYYVVNTSWSPRTATITLPAAGMARDITGERDVGAAPFEVSLEPAELRAYHVP